MRKHRERRLLLGRPNSARHSKRVGLLRKPLPVALLCVDTQIASLCVLSYLRAYCEQWPSKLLRLVLIWVLPTGEIETSGVDVRSRPLTMMINCLLVAVAWVCGRMTESRLSRTTWVTEQPRLTLVSQTASVSSAMPPRTRYVAADSWLKCFNSLCMFVHHGRVSKLENCALLVGRYEPYQHRL